MMEIMEKVFLLKINPNYWCSSSTQKNSPLDEIQLEIETSLQNVNKKAGGMDVGEELGRIRHLQEKVEELMVNRELQENLEGSSYSTAEFPKEGGDSGETGNSKAGRRKNISTMSTINTINTINTMNTQGKRGKGQGYKLPASTENLEGGYKLHKLHKLHKVDKVDKVDKVEKGWGNSNKHIEEYIPLVKKMEELTSNLEGDYGQLEAIDASNINMTTNNEPSMMNTLQNLKYELGRLHIDDVPLTPSPYPNYHAPHTNILSNPDTNIIPNIVPNIVPNNIPNMPTPDNMHHLQTANFPTPLMNSSSCSSNTEYKEEYPVEYLDIQQPPFRGDHEPTPPHMHPPNHNVVLQECGNQLAVSHNTDHPQRFSARLKENKVADKVHLIHQKIHHKLTQPKQQYIAVALYDFAAQTVYIYYIIYIEI